MASSSRSAAQHPDKRRRLELAQVIAGTGLSVAPQAAGLGVSKHEAMSEVHKYDKVSTPFGPLYASLKLRTVGGDELPVQYLNPFATLWFFASISVHAAAFFAQHLAKGMCRIAFYCDGVKPGNVLRPDVGRSFEAVYWTFFELPQWFRSNASASWFPCCFVETKTLKDVPGGMAAVAKAVVEVFFPAALDAFNFERTGVLIGPEGSQHHIRATFGCWLADEKAIKEVVSCKGASGIKPCICCKNVVNRMEPVDGYLQHISCADTALFDPQTQASLTYMAVDLAAKSRMLSSAEFEFLQKAYGLVYEPAAILFDEHCRSVARFPDTIYWDWMHCLLASGGIAQYQVNLVVLEIGKAGVSLASIDEFCSNVSMPASRAKLSRTFFQDRVVPRPDSHIKAFASEMLTVVQVLGIFLDAVVRPAGVLQNHIVCFDLLREIAMTLVRGDDVAKTISRLRQAVKSHHELFAELYPDHIRPKLHYLKHVVDCIGKTSTNLSCFGPERRHKDAKAIASFSYHSVCKSMLVRMVYDLFASMSDHSTFCQFVLGPPTKLDDRAAGLVSRVAGQQVVVSNEMKVRGCSLLKVGDVVWLTNPVKLAKIRLAVQTSTSAEEHRFLLVVDLFRQHQSGAWMPTIDATEIVDAAAVSTTCCYVSIGDRMFV